MSAVKRKPAANAAWGGRFAAGPAEIMQRINASLDVDKRLYAQDIAGSLAHGAMLVKRRIIARKDGDAIVIEITRYPDAVRKELGGKLLKVLGDPEDPRTEIEKILA